MNVPTYIGGALFMRAYRLLRRDVVVCLEKYQLIPTSWALLGIISQAPNGIRLNEAAEALSVKAPLITNMADELINRGIIVRVEHPTDKRAKLLVLTADGKKLMKKVEHDVRTTLEMLLNDVTEPEIDAFGRVLQVIISNATA